MKKLSLVALFVVVVLNVQSQTSQNAIWSLPPKYAKWIGNVLQPSIPLPIPATGFWAPNMPGDLDDAYDGQIPEYAHNAMQDKDGNLLFFIVDGRIFDKDGRNIARFETIQDGSFITVPILSGANEMLLIPDPENCSKYYIFGDASVMVPGSNVSSPMYTTIDLSDPDLIYSLVLYPQSISGSFPVNAFNRNVHNKYAATKLRPDNSRLVFINSYAYLHIFKIDASGVSFLQTITPNGAQTINFAAASEILLNRAELEVVETTNALNQLVYRVGYSYEKGVSGSTSGWIVCSADVNYNTLNFVSGSDEYVVLEDGLTEANIHGLEFSPNGNTLYFTHETNSLNPNAIEYHVIGSGNNSKQPLLVANAQDFQFTEIELGKNGEMLFVGEQSNVGNRLAKLSNPNFPSPSNWLDYSLTVNYNFSIAGGWSNGYPPKKLYLLPDQIDGMNYADHFIANLACCIANTTFTTGIDNPNHQQYGTQTWNTTTTGNNPFATDVITVKDELIIKNGANITANNLTFKFAPDAKLVVEQGAIFTVNNCTLTVENTCESSPMWNGVEVLGPTNSRQTLITNVQTPASDAGKFFANNSIIEHAYMATHNFSTVKSGTPGEFLQTGNRGGVILATNTTFRNNHRGMVFFDFQNTNGINGIDDESKFNNCTFITDDLLNKPALTPSVIMAHLFGVQSVNFYGCDFKTTITDPSITPTQRGAGILAYNCLLTVSSLTTGISTDRSTFTDMTQGIVASSSLSSARTTRVRNTDFNNVWRGIYLKSNNLAMVLNNTFDVASDNGWGRGYGLYLDFCNKYKVENNAFNTTHNGYIGTYTYESLGNNNNEIYKNTFNNFVVASAAAGNNSNGSAVNGGLGLEFRCNTYTNTSLVDIWVASGGIKPTHGQCINLLTPSNNTFSYTAFKDLWQETYVTNHITYQYSTGTNQIPRSTHINTTNTFPTLCGTFVYNQATSCPTHNTKSFVVLKDEYAAAKQQVTTLIAKIDDNNTQGLLTILESQSPGNVKNALMTASPYLSNEVLLAYLTTNVPNGHLQQVLLANSPLSEEVMAEVKLLNLPKGIKTQITNAQTGTSAMQELQIEIAYYKNEVDQIKSDILRYFLFDDAVEERLKEALEFLNQGECTRKQCELTEFYIANKEYAKATQELSALTGNIEDADFVKLFTNIIELEQTADPVQELATNPIKQQPIIEVAEATNRKQETARAEVMLKRAKLRNYQETIEELNIGGSGLRLMNQEELLKTQNSTLITQHSITVYPNPTSGKVNITHNLSIENGKVTFKVYNMLGVEVLNENLSSTNNEVKINNLKSGVYFYTITQNNQTVKTDKLMVR